MKTNFLSFILVSFVFVVACAPAEQAGKSGPSLTETQPGSSKDGKADRWSTADDPSLFSHDLEYRLDALPQEGEATNVPWTGTYWPVYKDSINVRWQGDDTKSPAAKYGEAFNVPNVEDRVSQYYGVERHNTRTECEANDDCDSTIGERCAKREGAEKGRCIPTWWGICHAWAPVSIQEPEPVHPVTRNGITFEVNDIKALLTLAYDRSTSKFVSLRCNKNNSKDEIEYDAYDRPSSDDAECSDTNPGTLHVLLANYLGIKGESFVEDRTFDAQVWNQPIRGYRVTQMKELVDEQGNVDGVAANTLVGVPEGVPNPDEFEFSGVVGAQEWMQGGPYPVVAGRTLRVVLTGSGDADVYARFDGEPSAEEHDCRPFNATTEEECEIVVPEGKTQVYVGVNGNAETSTFEVHVTLEPDPNYEVPTTYLFNDGAAKLYHVKTQVQYIAESEMTTDGNLADKIDQYTRTDYYQYILEVDVNGDIIGGEWIGASKKNHPDFLWLPTGRRSSPIAGGAIKYAKVKELLNASILGEDESNPAPSYSSKHESGSVEKDAWVNFGPYLTDNGEVKVNMVGDGDADLYVRKGEPPTKDNYDCRPFLSNTAEECRLNGPGPVYVSVFGYVKSHFELSISFNEPGEGVTDPTTVPEVTEPDPETDHVNEGQWKYYGPYDVEAGDLKVSISGSGDADLYVREGAQPTSGNYDCRPYKSGSEEECLMEGAGKYYVSIYGYKDADFELIVTPTEAGSVTDPEVTEPEVTEPEIPTAFTHLNETGHVAKDEMKVYTLNVAEAQKLIIQTLAQEDVDLYLRFGQAPTRYDYDVRAFNVGGNETLDYTAATAGALFVGIHGYEEADFTVTSTDP
jgi:hypothetical protein